MSSAGFRNKDVNWLIPNDMLNDSPTMQGAMLSVLMDIRDELKQLNKSIEFVRQNTLSVSSTLKCDDFQGIPRVLKRIRANTSKPRKNPKV